MSPDRVNRDTPTGWRAGPASRSCRLFFRPLGSLAGRTRGLAACRPYHRAVMILLRERRLWRVPASVAVRFSTGKKNASACCAEMALCPFPPILVRKPPGVLNSVQALLETA